MMKRFKAGEFFSHLYKKLIAPKSKKVDDARAEYILNILLVGVISLTGIGFLINVVDPILYPSSQSSGSPILTAGICLAMLSLLLLSRNGKSKISAFIFIFLLTFVAVFVSYSYGADLPSSILLFAVVVIMSGILITTKAAFIVALFSGSTILFISYLEVKGTFIPPESNWKSEPIHMTDSFVYFIMLGIIFVVSWLSNREIQRALKRAFKSEEALKKQRDRLEILVGERTNQLQIAQAEKVAQLYRFAEFGRLSSGLFHDLVTPLTLVSLNLNRLSRLSKTPEEVMSAKTALKRALVGTKRLENFISAAQKQIQDRKVLRKFSIIEEINQTLGILEYKSSHENVRINFLHDGDIKIYSNPLKFSQLIANLVSNAIDSYEGTRRESKNIELKVEKTNKSHIKLSIQDWGKGIEKSHIGKVFDPLFTTKSFKKGTGMGLSICKDTVEHDLKGTIIVDSVQKKGTTFTIVFPNMIRS